MAQLNRRNFLKIMGAATAASLTPSLTFAQSASLCSSQKKTLVLFHLGGGLHSLSLLPPRLLQEYFDKHPDTGITNSRPLTPQVGLNPACLSMYDIYTGQIPALAQAGVGVTFINQAGILRSDGREGNSRSHEDGTKQWNTALMNPYGAEGSGFMGRYANRFCKNDGSELFNFVVLNGVPDAFTGPGITQVTASSLNTYGYTNDNFNTGARTGVTAASSNRFVIESIRQANDLQGPPANPGADILRITNENADAAQASIQAALAAYPAPPAGTYLANNPLNGRFQNAVALINASARGIIPSLTGISLSQGGYDTHSGQGNGSLTNPTADPNLVNSYSGQLARLLRQLDAGIGGFFRDLARLGLLNNALLAVTSEFGRTFENNNTNQNGQPVHGTDHGTGGQLTIIGPGVKNQVAYANYTGAHFTGRADWLPTEVDIRNVYSEIHEKFFGVDPSLFLSPDAYPKLNLGIFA
ncbi:MAG: DUF1501 domain-containing protein [Deltaproteobacteria bacterium]|nr:DUF1501 domain-containing protein [Deltaproteobacteria bacterium]